MRKSKITAIHKLNDLENKDPKDFWKQLKQIISPCEDYTKYISPENWLQHFKSVLQTAPSETTNVQFQSYVEASLPNLEKVAEQSEALNATITAKCYHNIRPPDVPQMPVCWALRKSCHVTAPVSSVWVWTAAMMSFSMSSGSEAWRRKTARVSGGGSAWLGEGLRLVASAAILDLPGRKCNLNCHMLVRCFRRNSLGLWIVSSGLSPSILSSGLWSVVMCNVLQPRVNQRVSWSAQATARHSPSIGA